MFSFDDVIMMPDAKGHGIDNQVFFSDTTDSVYDSV